jgi:MFS family permease
MTEMTDLAGAAGRARDVRIVGLVSGAHFVSHVYILLLPPLFVFIRADYHVSYAELGVVIAAFNLVSALFQAPAGFVADRLGARRLLIAGLALSATSIALAGLLPSYWALVVCFAFLGLANTTYHPADYAILSHAIGSKRIGQAFSVHTFFGILGSAVAPGSMLLLASHWGWRGALFGAAALGYAMALVLLQQKSALPDAREQRAVARKASAAQPDAAALAGWRLLLSPPILRNVAFYGLLAVASGGIYNFSIVALGALYGTPQPVANLALSAFLLLSATGVLAGGIIADRTKRHDLVAAAGFAASAAALTAIALISFGAPLLVTMMALAGFLNGVIMPSRDMIVRASTPPGSFGKVFGFVSTGFNVGGVVAPLLFGLLMDQGHPRAVFLVVAAFTLLALPLVTRRTPAAA